MSFGSRLKEERNRLGMTQADMAKIAGVSARSLISWEKGEAAPNALALVAFAEEGADVLYILTGRHAPNRPENAVSQIEDDLSEIERDLLNPGRLYPGLDDEEADERIVPRSINRLKMMLTADKKFLTTDLEDRASSLFEIASDPMKLSLFRAADYTQMRKKREQMKERLAGWLEGAPYEPNETVMSHLTRLALDFAVPVKELVEIVHEIHTNIVGRLPDRIEGLRN